MSASARDVVGASTSTCPSGTSRLSSSSELFLVFMRVSLFSKPALCSGYDEGARRTGDGKGVPGDEGERSDS